MCDVCVMVVAWRRRERCRAWARHGRANVFISWALNCQLEDLIDVMKRYLDEHGLDRTNTFFWVCDFSIRQNNAKEDVGRLGEVVASIKNTLMVGQSRRSTTHNPYVSYFRTPSR